MSRQGRLLAGQAVASALILIVVYFTLLRPEGGGELSRVEAPPNLPPSGQQANNRADRGTEERSGANRRGGTIAPGTTAPGTTPPGIVGTEPPVVPPGPTGDQPTDDQYSDTLGLLRARIGSG
jgi:hypothetical protein